MVSIVTPNTRVVVWMLMVMCILGNKYGEPVVTGFTRSFGQRTADQQRVEWIKPIMFTAGSELTVSV